MLSAAYDMKPPACTYRRSVWITGTRWVRPSVMTRGSNTALCPARQTAASAPHATARRNCASISAPCIGKNDRDADSRRGVRRVAALRLGDRVLGIEQDGDLVGRRHGLSE